MVFRRHGTANILAVFASGSEVNAVEQLQRAYGDKYRPLAMLDSKRKASGLLHEYADEQAVQKLKRAQQQKIQSEHTPPIKEKTNRL